MTRSIRLSKSIDAEAMNVDSFDACVKYPTQWLAILLRASGQRRSDAVTKPVTHSQRCPLVGVLDLDQACGATYTRIHRCGNPASSRVETREFGVELSHR